MNQRTNGPVTLTWQLVLGRERNFALFHNFKHVYSPRAWAYNHLVQVLASVESIYYSHHLVPVPVPLHVYSLRAGADNPLGTKFWCQQKGLITLPIVASFKKISLKSDFIHIFNGLIQYSPRAGTDNPLGTKFDVNRKALSLCPFIASFNKMSLKSEFIHIFNDIIHVYSPRAEAGNPLGTKFDINRKALSLCPFAAYSPRAWAYNHLVAF